jgi:acetyl esterase/lipase
LITHTARIGISVLLSTRTGYLRVRSRIGPRSAAEHRGLPPTLVVSCEYDPLRTDGIKFVEALKAAGVDTLHTRVTTTCPTATCSSPS